MKKRTTVICDLQFGSTGKGLIAGYYAEKYSPDTVVTQWSPNAGHTFIDSDGNKMVHTMLANGCVSPGLQRIMIGPGSVLNFDSLETEIENARKYGYLGGVDILIHEHCALVNEGHRNAEEAFQRIGSTSKGSAEAVIDKMRRDPNPQEPKIASQRWSTDMVVSQYTGGPGSTTIRIVEAKEYAYYLDVARHILVEGAQGFSLGMHQGFYPYCTSRECTPQSICTDAGIPYHWVTRIIGTLRPYPIRVSNRFDADGNMVGYSGDFYPDSQEISWADIGQKPEKTTVTKLERRVATFSVEQLHDALRYVGDCDIFMNFMNYLNSEQQAEWMEQVIEIAGKYNARVKFTGYGATCDDIIELGHQV